MLPIWPLCIPDFFNASINYSLNSKKKSSLFFTQVYRNLLKVLQYLFQSSLLSADGVLYFHLQSMGYLFCLCVQLLLLSMGNVGADQGQDAHIN